MLFAKLWKTGKFKFNSNAVKKFFTLSVIYTIFCYIIFPTIGYTATLYVGPNENYTTIQAGIAAMNSGDTLVIRDGTYKGDSNMIDWDHRPPNGIPGNYTVIKAENRGKVFIDGEYIRRPLSLEHDPGISYIIFDGIKFGRSNDHVFRLGYANHVKILNCSAFDAGAGEHLISSYHSSYLLYENCWGWGHCQYGMHMRVNDHCIVRRCVMRIDYALPEDPWTAPFFNYESNYVEWQNCITIDSDQLSYLDDCEYGTGGLFGFLMGNNGVINHDVKWRGSINLNCATQGFLLSECDYSIALTNNLFWDSKYKDMIYVKGSTAPQLVVDHCTVGENAVSSARGVYCSGFTGATVTNSIVHGITNGVSLRQIATADHNCFYNNAENLIGTTSDNSFIDTIDPTVNSLKYLLRIEDGSDLKSAGGNGDVGANIIKRIGVNATLWGEAGYNTTTDENLWPFPNEDLIKADMSSYSYDGGKLSGARGFCEGNSLDGSPQTLTKYIWEYLGNSIPPEIYGGGGSNQKPYASAGSDQELTDSDDNGLEQVTLDASASYDPDGSIISYVWSENGSQIATGVNPTITLDVGTHLLSLVTDNESATSTDEVCITINPAEGDLTPPVISNVQTLNVASMSATISWDTDEPSTTKVLYGLTNLYGQEVENVTLVTNHEVIISGLEPSSTYHFQVISRDGNNNEASSADYTFTTQSEGTTINALQGFEDDVVWIPGGGQDPTGNGRGWAFLDAGSNAKIEIDTIGANGSNHSLKVTFDSNNPQIYFRSNDKITDRMPEAQGANRMSFYVRFPEGFPIQQQPFRYDTWQLGTFIHDPNDWNDTHGATSESDHGIHHYYSRVTIAQVGNGWVKYIINTHPDQATYSGSTVPPNRSDYFDNFGRFYFHFGHEAGGPNPGRPFTIWIDEIKFYYDDGSIGGQIHDGGQDDAGFDGEFIPDSAGTPDISTSVNFQPAGRPIPDGFDADYGYVWDNDRGYGWDQDVSGKARDKNVNPDQLLDTYIYADDSVRTWEIALPNGQYKVSLACGEPEYSRGNHKVILEGEEVVNGSTQPDEFIRVENHPVTLADGRLTVQIGGGAAVADPWGLTSLNYIIIESVSGSALPPPNSLSAQPTNSIELLWSNVTGAVGYNLYRSITQGIGYVKINSDPVTGTSYVDKNITPGVTYYYVVTSLNSDGVESSYSPEASCTEPLTPTNQAPQITGFTAVPSSLNNPGETTMFNVSATDPDGDSLTYTINFGDGTASESGSEVVHTYASAGTYTADVTVDDGHGNIVGESLQITVDDVPPAKPTGVTVK